MNLGPAEILVVLVVALIVFGPKRLPEVGRQVGAAMRELRRMQHSVTSEINQALNLDGDDHPVDLPSSASEEIDHSAPQELPAPDAPFPEEPDDGFTNPRSFS